MADNLLCLESIAESRASMDPVIFRDPRILDNMLANEAASVVSADYFATTQKDTHVRPYMRADIVEWMMEVCDDLSCDTHVFPLAVKLLDMTLASITMQIDQLQLLGATCMHIASKLRSTKIISTKQCSFYSDHSFNTRAVNLAEIIILSTLQWKTSFLTAADFLEHILARMTVPRGISNTIRKHAHAIVQICSTDAASIQMKPSVIGSGAIVAAIERLNGPEEKRRALRQVCHLTHHQPEEILLLVQLFTSRVSQTDKLATCTTPTDVEDINLDV
ncbi:G1/S-specific cyclin-D2-like [Neocloeon triangulifer]|uniref:G1/S-specific cyclin-D2-like n=1 Tax=Neocloeon triangulifer TaxID=2078957 RepID=UPI00286F6DA1|nr:G1/S-specific cyclin-D2-like [Neocloeon triangulifer]